MALNSGVYTITNLKNNNWAVLTNDNDDDNVVSGFSGDLDAGETVRPLLSMNWGRLKMFAVDHQQYEQLHLFFSE